MDHYCGPPSLRRAGKGLGGDSAGKIFRAKQEPAALIPDAKALFGGAV